MKNSYEIKILNSKECAITKFLGGETKIKIPKKIYGFKVKAINAKAFFRNAYEGYWLENVIIPNSVKSIGEHAFAGQTSLNKITLGKGVESIDKGAFEDCHSLTSITIPNSVKSIDKGAFEDCHSLTSITIPNSVKSIGQRAFARCNIKNLTIGAGITKIKGDVFYGNKIQDINVDKHSPVYHSAGNCLIKTESKTLVLGCKNSVIPDDGSVTSIGDEAFASFGAPNNIAIPDSVTSIGEHAFYLCDEITNVTIPDSVNSIGDGAFSYCVNITKITIPRKVATIGRYTFCNCKKLKEINLSNGLIEIKSEALAYSGLTRVTIPDSVREIGWEAFQGCRDLETISIGQGIHTLPVRVFKDCENLKQITLPESIEKIDDSAFWGCKNLEKINVPKCLREIDTETFADTKLAKEKIQEFNKRVSENKKRWDEAVNKIIAKFDEMGEVEELRGLTK